MTIDQLLENPELNYNLYPPIPRAVDKWWNGVYWQVALVVEKWQFCETYKKWGALVTFDDGKRVFTYPRNPETGYA